MGVAVRMAVLESLSTRMHEKQRGDV